MGARVSCSGNMPANRAGPEVDRESGGFPLTRDYCTQSSLQPREAGLTILIEGQTDTRLHSPDS